MGREPGGVTRLARISEEGTPSFLGEVAGSLRAGGMVVFPTDTLYGLGVDPRSSKGLPRLLAAKKREEGRKPIPLLLDEPSRALEWASRIPDAARRLMDRFWPGALTIVLPARPEVPPPVTGGGGTVGLRVPDHPVSRALAGMIGGAVTGTSANRAGAPGIWRSAEEIIGEFSGEADWVLWDGPRPAAGETAEGPRSPGSTVVRAEEDTIVLLREGVIPFRTVTEYIARG